MKYILDTNIVSELIAKQPNKQVIEWLQRLDPENLFLSVITMGEIRKGIEKLPESLRKKNIQAWFENELLMGFEERILTIDLSVILLWGELLGELEKKGRKLPPLDSLIAATTKYHSYTLVTRNTKDFKGIDILVFNPFEN
ncbi:MAG: type II toxin-antitoxin system VapC family toxin [Dolichospermum sp. DET50]|jgi:toxin FitB|nr:type II toxin-antitoxin system VapC family toxin [Dolichospermum sp. DET66]MBS3031873.1 type II toxin-antitoxin system VapC family toxin [Dolichospermum sp. DET67]MBS3037083.1 type II toxin-antitoxin system VapC family toxin [Dolichospermum sp. DET50]QSX69088.1 MAG: type II toxin-antitoxin system VapC family toxin [Dolichospermum sp. DET69]